MKVLEVRRHSIRFSSEQHLNQEGVSLARSVGNSMGSFRWVATSSLPRAFETAIAMGFAVNEQSELLCSYGVEVDAELPWPASFAEYSKAVQRRGAVKRYADQLEQYYRGVLERVPDGGAVLVVNHGGVVEIGVTGCMTGWDFLNWGGAVGYCEGVRLTFDNGVFIYAEELRIRS